MNSGLRIGRLFGITIRIDWSWLLIFFLITFNLSAVFIDHDPDWSPALRWGTALLASILFFASLLAHELAHSLVARARGIPVRSITLFLFGGVSNIERDPDSPKSEFLITVVGPLSSLVIGLVLLVIGNIVAIPLGDTVNDPEAMIASMSPLTMLLLWLGSINIVLAAFNLIPGFPLDGGRILRSILWATTDNLCQATRWAAQVGQFVAWAFIFAGMAMIFGFELPFFGTGLVGGIWLAFIGWFLNSAAIQSYQRDVIHDMLEDVPVVRMMRPDPPTVPPNITVSALANNYVMPSDDHAFPVIEADQLVGMICLEDVRTVPREN